MDATGTVLAAVTKTFDKLGQRVTYTDGAGSATTTTYDRYGQPATATDTATDAQGTRTIGTVACTYDRAKDPRGLLTSFTDSVAGTCAATWGPDGQVQSQTLPGGVALTQPRHPPPPGGLRPDRIPRRMAGLRPPLPLRIVHGTTHPTRSDHDHSSDRQGGDRRHRATHGIVTTSRGSRTTSYTTSRDVISRTTRNGLPSPSGRPLCPLYRFDFDVSLRRRRRGREGGLRVWRARVRRGRRRRRPGRAFLRAGARGWRGWSFQSWRTRWASPR